LGLTDDPEVADPDLLDHGRSSARGSSRWSRSATVGAPACVEAPGRPLRGRTTAECPRHPWTYSPNLLTRRVVNGAGVSRAIRTGTSLSHTSSRDPGGASSLRRPSFVSTAPEGDRSRISTATT